MKTKGNATDIMKSMLISFKLKDLNEIPKKVLFFNNFQKIHVSDIVLSANIRFLRESGIESLVGSIKTLGYVFTSQLTVSEPHEGETKYHLIDGAHRWTAVCRLAEHEDHEISQRYTNYVFDCHVLPPLKHKQEMALAYGNYYLSINIY